MRSCDTVLVLCPLSVVRRSGGVLGTPTLGANASRLAARQVFISLSHCNGRTLKDKGACARDDGLAATRQRSGRESTASLSIKADRRVRVPYPAGAPDRPLAPAGSN